MPVVMTAAPARPGPSFWRSHLRWTTSYGMHSTMPIAGSWANRYPISFTANAATQSGGRRFSCVGGPHPRPNRRGGPRTPGRTPTAPARQRRSLQRRGPPLVVAFVVGVEMGRAPRWGCRELCVTGTRRSSGLLRERSATAVVLLGRCGSGDDGQNVGLYLDLGA